MDKIIADSMYVEFKEYNLKLQDLLTSFQQLQDKNNFIFMMRDDEYTDSIQFYFKKDHNGCGFWITRHELLNCNKDIFIKRALELIEKLD
jgi:hypothetical protein